jgi:signal transduction histidine kinase
MVCHEFRNPLNTIALSVSSLKRYEALLSAQQKQENLHCIAANVERMTQMMDDIMVISKLESNRLELQRDRLNLVQFCTDLIAELQNLNTDLNLNFQSRPKELMLTTDASLLRSIVTNILSNAIRYSPQKQPITFKVYRHKQQVILHVEDQGIGIPAEDLAHLFEPFHRGKNVSNIPGTGLGLSIVKQFVELQNGKIEVKSAVGQGTTFRVLLPC